MAVLLERNEQRHLQIHCKLCPLQKGKAKMQMYPLQMTDIPDWPSDKIAIDLITYINVCTSGNQYIPTITDHMMGWPEAFLIPDKKVNTIVCVFMNNYLPVHVYPSFILSDNGIEFKNQPMDNNLALIFLEMRNFRNELKLIRSECQKDPWSEIIPWPTLQCFRSLRIQKRKMKGQEKGCYQGSI